MFNLEYNLMAFDLKTFLRPSWTKAIIAAVIFFICANWIISANDYWAIPALNLYHSYRCDPVPCQTQDISHYVLFAAVISYILACILTDLYQKYANPKK